MFRTASVQVSLERRAFSSMVSSCLARNPPPHSRRSLMRSWSRRPQQAPDPTLSVPLPWKDAAQVFNGGQHPWRIDGTFSSSVLLFNPDQHDANSITFSVFSNGQAWTKFVSVPPLATVPMSLNDIILNQEPDNKGRKLPRTTTSG